MRKGQPVYINYEVWLWVPYSLTQIFAQVASSVIIGYLTDYFGIEEPTAEDTRDAYLYGLGNQLSCCEIFHSLSVTWSARPHPDSFPCCIVSWPRLLGGRQDRDALQDHLNCCHLSEGGKLLVSCPDPTSRKENSLANLGRILRLPLPLSHANQIAGLRSLCSNCLELVSLCIAHAQIITAYFIIMA